MERGRGGREGGRKGEGDMQARKGGARAKPGNQLVQYTLLFYVTYEQFQFVAKCESIVVPRTLFEVE